MKLNGTVERLLWDSGSWKARALMSQWTRWIQNGQRFESVDLSANTDAPLSSFPAAYDYKNREDPNEAEVGRGGYLFGIYTLAI